MKNYYKFIYLLSLSMLMSCEGFFDRFPNDALSPTSFWKTQSDAEIALIGCYKGFESGNSILERDCASDNAFSFTAEEWKVSGNGNLSPTTCGMNEFDYKTIRKCNEFLENIDNVPFADEKIKRQYIAEARFLRAYRYYILSQWYGAVPLVKNTFATTEEAKVPRTPRTEVEAFIETELTSILPDLKAELTKADKGRISKGAAQTLLLRLYMFNKKWNEALRTAQSIKGYSLVDSYSDLFHPMKEDNTESILDIQYIESDARFSFEYYMPASKVGWSRVVPMQNIVDAYEMSDGQTIKEATSSGTYDPKNPFINRDPRMRESLLYPGQFWQGRVYASIVKNDMDNSGKGNNSTKTGYNLKKYFDELSLYADYKNTGRNIMVFRYAEVLLSIAEAKIELNLLDDDMYKAIDAVRTRGGQLAVNRQKYNTQDKLRELIRRERRVELAFEGIRRFDIIRWGIGADVLNGKVYGCRLGTVTTNIINTDGDVELVLDGEPLYVEDRKFDPAVHTLFPVPIIAIDKNPKLLPNNPGY